MSEEKDSVENPKAPSKVWVVEDNETLSRGLARVLDQQKDMKCVHEYERCEVAIEALVAGERPNVMLFDMALPGMSGIEGIRRIKTALPEIEILVFSVFDDNEKVFNAICAGASGYLLKTSSRGEIPDAIRDVLAGGAPINAFIARRALDMFCVLDLKGRDYGLTEREKEVLEQTVDGLTKNKIADRLDLSFYTVDKHIKGIYSKLHVNIMTGGLREWAWLIGPGEKTWQQMLARFRETAATFLTAPEYTFMAHGEVYGDWLPLEDKRDIFLIYKEVLNNIIRHANAKNVKIEIDCRKGTIQLLIEDDGDGFNSLDREFREGNGLRNLRMRAQAIGGNLKVRSTLNEGTSVRLTLELP